jgi:hypothetical protein
MKITRRGTIDLPSPAFWRNPIPDRRIEALPLLYMQRSVGGGSEPVWRRDGRELFYRSLRGDMFAVPVTPGAGFSHGIPHRLFAGTGLAMQDFHRSYDVSPDGKRFLMATRGGSEIPALAVVFNWRQELQRLRSSP